MKRGLLIVGGGGHGKVVADIAKLNGYEEIAFLDDNSEVVECGGYAVVGKSEDAQRYHESDFIVAIGNASLRQKKQEYLKEIGANVVSLVHPSAVVAESAVIGEGSVVMAGAVINPCSTIGEGCIINTCSSVDHDCVIENYAHISIGSHIAGSVGIGARTWIGAGATVSNNLSIVGDCIIGAGAVVVKCIEQAGVYVGVPAALKK